MRPHSNRSILIACLLVVMVLVTASPVKAGAEDGELPGSKGACYYSLLPFPAIWAESNDVGGLQQRGTYVNGHYIPPDTKDPDPQLCYGTPRD